MKPTIGVGMVTAQTLIEDHLVRTARRMAENGVSHDRIDSWIAASCAAVQPALHDLRPKLEAWRREVKTMCVSTVMDAAAAAVAQQLHDREVELLAVEGVDPDVVAEMMRVQRETMKLWLDRLRDEVAAIAAGDADFDFKILTRGGDLAALVARV